VEQGQRQPRSARAGTCRAARGSPRRSETLHLVHPRQTHTRAPRLSLSHDLSRRSDSVNALEHGLDLDALAEYVFHVNSGPASGNQVYESSSLSSSSPLIVVWIVGPPGAVEARGVGEAAVGTALDCAGNADGICLRRNGFGPLFRYFCDVGRFELVLTRSRLDWMDDSWAQRVVQRLRENGVRNSVTQ
jgi:hypothetical protein